VLGRDPQEAALVTSSEPATLQRTDVTPPLSQYVVSTWRQRALAWAIARSDLQSRHGSTLLGWVWNLLDPLLMMGVYWLIFGLLLQGLRPDNFLAFLTIGMFLFQFAQNSVTQGANAITANLGLVREMRFPRALLPLADLMRNGLNLAWQLPVMFVIVVGSVGNVRVGWLLLLFVLIPLLAVFSFGVALVTARLTSVVTDVARLLPYVFRLLFYVSGVLFPLVDILAGHPAERFLPLNPYYSFISLGRHLILAPIADPGPLWLSVFTWSAVSIVVGLTFFLRSEHRYGRG
jgi:teichoic acid transport system permease protein